MANIKEELGKGKLHVMIIIEILGRPANFVEQALSFVVSGLEKEQNIEIIGKQIHKPKEVEKGKIKLFSAFAEIEIIAENMKKVVELIFDYMPSSVEIMGGNITIDITEANTLLNDLTARLHKYDALAKTLNAQKTILLNQLKQAGIKPSMQLPAPKKQKKKSRKKKKH